MRIDKPLCIHNELKSFCKYYSDGNCILNISEEQAPCEKCLGERLCKLEKLEKLEGFYYLENGKAHPCIATQEVDYCDYMDELS